MIVFAICVTFTRSPLGPGSPPAPGSPFCPASPGGPLAPAAPMSTESADAPYSTNTHMLLNSELFTPNIVSQVFHNINNKDDKALTF